MTSIVKLLGADGVEVQVRALVDPCSQSTIISGTSYQKLQLKSRKVHIPILGTGGQLVSTATKATFITVKSRIQAAFTCCVEALVLNKVSSYKPPLMRTSIKLPHLDGSMLADPQYMEPSQIDLLLGASVYSQIVEGSVIKGRMNEPIETRTSLGWIL